MPLKDREARREYHRNYMREYLQRPGRMAGHVARVQARRDATQEWIRTLRIECGHCGENRPQALDFHHRVGETKIACLGEVAHLGWSKGRILAEIEKCDVLCSNCHRVEHADW